MSISFDEKAERIKIIIENLKAEQLKIKDSMNKQNPFITNFTKYKDIEELDRDILVSLIDVIYISENSDINIVFKYGDEYKRLSQLIKDKKQQLA